MHILLIQPKMTRRPMDTGLKAKMSPSLALLTIKNLVQPPHTVRIVNENIEKIDYRCRPDLVSITVTVDVLDRAAEIAGRFRRRGIPVVAGGIHITSDPGSARGRFDCLCIGRGEATWPQMLEDLRNHRLQPEYWDSYRDPAILSPDYHIDNHRRYIYTNVVATSRGCPYRCDFCYNSCAASMPFTTRPMEDVLRDIAAIGRRHILFIDDNFCGDPGWTMAFLDRLVPLRLKWSAAVCANIATNTRLLDKMAESGCQSLFIGLESINPHSLRQVHKSQNNVSLYRRLIRELHSRDIMLNASLVFGLPGDNIQTFSHTVEWLVEHKIETATAHILTPYPGTALYRRMRREGTIVDHNLSHYDTAHVVFRHDTLTASQLYNGYVGFYRDFYSLKNIARRLPQSKKQRIPYLCFNLFYRKFGRATELLAHLVPLNALGRFAAWVSYRPRHGGQQEKTPQTQ